MPSRAENLVLIVGPTAVGKSGLAVELAVRFEGEIISADSTQVYRGFDIGSDKPTPEMRRRVSHHLIDLVGPETQFNAADFVREALGAVETVQAAGRLPFVVGGTGLYVRSLLDGLFPGPGRDPAVRQRLEAEAREKGLESLYSRLREADPEYAGKTGPRDRVRIVRALEVFELTGKPFSAHFADTRPPLKDMNIVKIGLDLPRPELYARIDARVERMFREGLLEEAGRLLGSGVSPEAPPFRALGYRQARLFLSGACSLEEAKESAKTETRHFAKRQLTWFRKMPGFVWFQAGDIAGVEKHLRRNLK